MFIKKSISGKKKINSGETKKIILYASLKMTQDGII
jgi:hypothetical protein